MWGVVPQFQKSSADISLLKKKGHVSGAGQSIKPICSSCLALLQNFQEDIPQLTKAVFLLFQFSDFFRVKRP